ncbi:MAG: DUF2147 domain-containing protein [Lysobacteraceae bacterium]
MRKFLIVAASGLLLSMPLALSALAQEMNSPVGTWRTIDDKTNKPKSLVEITEVNGKLSGRIIELFRDPAEEQNPMCEMCKGSLHNKPIKGLVILWGLSKDGDEWHGGSIMDPKTGKVYKAKLEVENGGKDLSVRGFLGFSMFGRSQTWHREK